jgi:hypothetical protein
VVYEDQQDSAAAVEEEELVRKCPYQEMNQQSEKTLLVYIQNSQNFQSFSVTI